MSISESNGVKAFGEMFQEKLEISQLGLNETLDACEIEKACSITNRTFNIMIHQGLTLATINNVNEHKRHKRKCLVLLRSNKESTWYKSIPLSEPYNDKTQYQGDQARKTTTLIRDFYEGKLKDFAPETIEELYKTK